MEIWRSARNQFAWKISGNPIIAISSILFQGEEGEVFFDLLIARKLLPRNSNDRFSAIPQNCLKMLFLSVLFVKGGYPRSASIRSCT